MTIKTPSKSKMIKRYLIEMICGLLFIYFSFVGYLTYMQRSMMYFPSPAQKGAVVGYDAIEVETEDGLKLVGYFHPPENDMPIIVHFHGNASSAPATAPRFRKIVQAGYGLMLAEYRGYNGNPGKPTEAGLYKDAEAFLKWLENSRTYTDSRIVLYGESLGSGVAVEMAMRRQPAAVILDVPFKSALDVAQRSYGFIPMLPYLMQDQYRNDTKIAKIKAPILFLLAEQDEVVSFQGGLDLYNLANDLKSKEVFAQAHHGNNFEFGSEDAALKFLKKELP